MLIAIAVAMAAFVQGSTGVGFALIVAPIMGLLEPELLPVGLLALMVPLNAYILWRERQHIDRTGASWITVGRAAGTVSGVLVLMILTPTQLGLFVGLSTIAAVLASLLIPPFDPNRGAYLTSGVITGVTETATGIGGPPLALVYQHQPPPVVRSTIAFCFLIGELMSLTALALMHQTDVSQFSAAALLFPSLVIGMLLSQIVKDHINTKYLRRFVLAFATASGVTLLLH